MPVNQKRNQDLYAQLRCRPLLADGGFGTELMAAGLEPGGCAERWNLNHPEAVRQIHCAYREAGAELLTTNSFNGTSASLARHGLADQSEAINRAAAELARQAAGNQAWVLGSIGPFGGMLEPYGETPAAQVQEMFHRQAEALCAGGADAIVVETMHDPRELVLAVQAVRAVCDAPVFASYTFNPAGEAYRTMMGTTPQQAVDAALEAGATVVGANCGAALQMSNYLALAEQLVAAAGDAPVILQANAGTPSLRGSQTVFPVGPEQFAEAARRLLEIGVRVIGGCCGTTPRHTRALAAMMAGSDAHAND